MPDKSICRIGVFYDGSYFAMAQKYFYHDRQLGWLSFQPFHALIEAFVARTEQGFSSYKVVSAGWYQGMFTSKDATEGQLRHDRRTYHDLMHAGIDPRYLPMSQTQGEKGIDVAMAVDVLQVAHDGKVDIAVLVTGDGDFVPLVRALMKDGVRVAVAYFEYEDKIGKKSFINERLLNAANYVLNVNAMDKDKDFKRIFASLFRKVDKHEA